MKLLLDEMLAPDIARELRERGHDVETVAGHPDWASLSGSQLLTVARTERRAIVTNNLRDYRPLPGIPGNYRRTKLRRSCSSAREPENGRIMHLGCLQFLGRGLDALDAGAKSGWAERVDQHLLVAKPVCVREEEV